VVLTFVHPIKELNMARPNMFVLCAVALFLALAFAGSVTAAILHVPGDYPTIQAAVDAAVPLEDRVVVANGTYSGPGNTSVSVTKRIRIESEDLDPELCHIVGRGFLFSGDTNRAQTEVVGFTIRNGSAPSSQGGGIHFASAATVRNCIIRDCSANEGLGGGIYCSPESLPLIEDTAILSNSAGTGGGVYCASTGDSLTNTFAEFRNCTISENSAWDPGGGIDCPNGRIDLVGVVLDGNRAGDQELGYTGSGGGIHSINGHVRMVNCIITRNLIEALQGMSRGSGICVRGITGGATIAASLRMDNCLVRSNDAGILLEGAQHFGGGIFTSKAAVDIANCTIVDNGVSGVGGGYYEGTAGAPFPVVNINNTVFWSNDPEDMLIVSANNNVTLRNCALENGLAGISGAAPAMAINIFDDEPLFVDGPNDNYRLQYLSPYLNKGDAAFLPPDDLDVDGDGNPVETLPLDLDGNPRQTGPASCVDIGCFENTTPSSCLGDISGGSQGVPDCVVDVDDLVQVILAWERPGGAIDFEPQPCGNGSVTVDELVDVLLNWGPCPGSGCAGDEAMPQSIDDCYDKAAWLYPEGGSEFAQCFARCIQALCEADLIDCDE
jgi:hypothetical protein